MSIVGQEHSAQQLKVLVEIREAVGDGNGRLMQSELVEHIKRDYADAKRLRAAVAHMRHCQRKYFETRATEWLQQSKTAERQVDKMLAKFEDPQTSLF